MKKLILILSFVSVLFVSCSDSENSQKKEINERTESVLSETDLSTQRIMYNLLSGQDKLNMWTDKLNTMMNDPNLNQDQVNLLRELSESLNANIFDTSLEINDEREVFMNIYAKDFVDRARQIFTDQYVYDNLYNLSRIFLYLDYDNGAGSGTEECACNKSSYFTCGFSTYTCKSANCRNLSDGCGFLGMFECNGKCS